MNSKRKFMTHCQNGHEFTPENTKIQYLHGVKCRSCKTCFKAYMKKYNKKNKQRIYKKHNEYVKPWSQNKRSLCLFHYGGNKLACVCCGENTYQFLTLDHINGNGAHERKVHGNQLNIILKLIKNNFPEGYQTLCWNCNLAKHSNNGICPHKTRYKTEIPITLKWSSHKTT